MSHIVSFIMVFLEQPGGRHVLTVQDSIPWRCWPYVFSLHCLLCLLACDITAFIHSPRSVRIAGFLFNSTPAPDHHHQSLLNPFYLSPYQIDACQLSSTKGPSISQHGSLGPAAF
jgi:hypothetical protein